MPSDASDTPQVPFSSFDHKLGLQITELSAQSVRGWAPVEGNTQPFGLWHGGASATMVETLASLGATCWAGEGQAVGSELSVSHLRAVKAGKVHGHAKAIHLGRSSAIYLVELTNDAGQLIASGRMSCRVLNKQL